MSQTTRCPSCATAFRVVADQLRISDGWVRCGHCKEIFDATDYLQEAPEPALLSDMPLDRSNTPQQASPDGPVRVWSSARGAPLPEGTDSFSGSFLDDEPGPSENPGSTPFSAPALLTLDVPNPGLPTFLVAQDATEHAAQNKTTPAQETPAYWYSAADPDRGASETGTVNGGFVEEESGAPTGTVLHVQQTAVSGGYELPSAPQPEDDFEWLPEDAEPEPEATPESEREPAVEPEPEPEAEAEAEAKPGSEPAPLAEPASEPGGEPKPSEAEAGPISPAISSPFIAAMKALEEVDAPTVEKEAASGDTAQLGAPAADLDLSSVRGQLFTENPTEQDAEDSAMDAADEPSFVRTARRKAFWRQPAVRAVLVLLSLLLVAMLLLQVLLHQRNYLAAAQPQWLPFLKNLCVPLQCKVAPYRQISSVVVDSSSFNKVQGNTYQFALALKNTSDNVLEMPAIELTLTDAQDQPVLRRVLTRQDLSAPRTLAARGEWSAVLQIQLAVDGARIAGYRVLAFYP